MKRKKLIRHNFRTAVFTRDDHACRMCGATGNLDAHHITDRNEMPGGGYVAENGISLCPECHVEAERYHSSGKTEWPDGWHPNDLYKVIGSSHEVAVEVSRRRLC